MFCRSIFVLFHLAVVLSVLLRFTDSNYPFGIVKLFLHVCFVLCLPPHYAFTHVMYEHILCNLDWLNVRESRRVNQKRTIRRNWQHRVHKMKIHKPKHTTQYMLVTTIWNTNTFSSLGFWFPNFRLWYIWYV